MLFQRTLQVFCFQIPCLFLALLFSQAADATVNGTGHGFAPASTGTVTFDPVLPAKGEPFTVRMSGKWGNSCIPEQDKLTMWAEDNGGRQNVNMRTYFSDDPACQEQFEPTPYELSCTLPNWVWEVLNNEQHWNINISVQPTSNSNGIGSYWRQKFDPTYGLHTIPPRLGTGYWISADTPHQGLNVVQQGNTVVAYELTYNRVTGEPNWQYAMGHFGGNTLNGVARLINWLAPGGLRPDYDWITSDIGDMLIQPNKEDLHFDSSSFGLWANGVNRIWVHVGLWEKNSAVPYAYKRWVFALSDTQLPPVVPDMAGVWNLYGFDGQHLEQSHQIEFRAGTRVGTDLYQFSSLNEEWVLVCPVNLNGSGNCTLSNESLGWAMTYNLISDIYLKDGSIDPHFNGNYAYAPLVSSDGSEAEQTGILLRSGLHLPVLDLDENPASPAEPVVPPEGGGFWDRFSCSGP